MLAPYRKRWGTEEAFRFLHGQLGLDECQARSGVRQANHIRYCCMAYTFIVRESAERNLTPYQLKERLSLERERFPFTAIKPIFQGA